MKVASLQPLQPLPPLPPSPAAPSAPSAPAAPRREPHGQEQPPHSGPSPALPPCLTESDVPLTPGATLTGLAAQPIAHKPAVHLSASPIATVAGPAPGPVSGLIFNHKAPVQVPLDLEPIACKPSPPIIGGEQLAPVSPVGACGAASNSAPTASREEIAALELLLRSPESQAIVRDFGSASASASGVPGGNAVADSIIQRYGPDLAARLNQLHQAQNAVRQQYLDAMNAMRQARLPTQRTLGLDLRTIQSANEVVESLQRTGKLPPNYVTKDVARRFGWEPNRALNNHVPGGQMGGDIYANTQNVVPNAPGRIWYEADIGLQNTISRAKQPGTRLIYSNDGLLYVTRDHYANVICVGCWK